MSTPTAIHAVSAPETPTSPDGEGLLTGQDRMSAAVTVVALAVAVLALIGLVSSFATVTKALEPSFGGLAWLATLGIDLGILVFSALGLVLAMLDLHIGWLRLVPWSLTAATIYLNVAPQTNLIGIVAHAVLPALWVVAVEVGAHTLRARIGLASGRRMDSVRLSRWLLAPFSTLRLWRRMVLWETRSYTDALTRERSRVLALTDLQEAYGRRSWRWKAPRRTIALYRLGELAPAAAVPAVEAAPVPASAVTPALPAAPKRTRKARTKPATRTAPTADVTELVPAGRQIAARLAAEDRTLTRTALVDGLRADGHGISNAKAGQLLSLLREGNDSTDSLKEAS